MPARPPTRLSLCVGALLLATFAALPAAAQTAPAAAPAATAPASELESLVAPIALYPDDLVAIILPASTNPLQLVQAERFLQQRKKDPKAAIPEGWDDPVKALVNYPEVVTKMSQDLDWTSALGEAVVADAGEVMEAVQVFRRKAQAAGNLKSDDKQTVVVEKEVVKVVQANPEVIYVPQYDPATVVVAGYPPYPYYPAPYPVYYYPYPPGAALATGIIWGAAMGAIWNGGHYGASWGGGGNNNININIDKSRTNVAVGSGNTTWKSGKQPGQVSGSVGKTSTARAGDARAGGGTAPRASTSQAAPRSSSADRPAAGGGAERPAAGGGAGAGASPSASTRDASRGGTGGSGGSAFDGAGGSARQTQMDSSRGASSRASAGASAGAGARAGGGARGGGGGGRR